MPKEKLVPVLCDIHVAESAVLHLSGTTKDSTLHEYQNQLFAIHGVEREEVDSALAQLKRNPEMMREVYEEVMVELEKLKLQLD